MRIEPLTFPAPGGGALTSPSRHGGATVRSGRPGGSGRPGQDGRSAPGRPGPASAPAGLSLLDSLAARTADLSHLADVLIDCVQGGASVGWVEAPTKEAATAWWSAFLADPDHRTWVGRDESGRIVATASLALTSKANGTHRAEVVKLLVHRQARGHRFAPGLMATIERFARAEGLTLLTLDTETGSLAESLYRRWGWTEVGAVPGFAKVAGGALVSTTIFYKLLGGR
ncbi:GNAT family N-acetyltransferase [Oerskovia paurometabola]|uniref:GNAT family N-acetyltransferase n=1 Tax=Oerskovia paurometabola TaxID=162170 RepID=UPI0034201920